MKRVSRSRAGNATVLFLLLFFGVFMFFPFFYAVLQAFKPMNEIFQYPPKFYIVHPTLENFLSISQLVDNLWVPFGRYVVNTLLVSVVGTVLHVLLASMAAFPLAKYRFPGSRLFFEVVVLALMFNGSVTQIPQYVVMAGMGVIDSYLALLLPPLAGATGLFLMKQFMSGIPDAMLEAAQIDGAGRLCTWWQVVMPNVKAAWLTILIFAFQTYWNGAGSGYIYTESLKPLPTILNQIATAGVARAGTGAAVTVLLMLPPVLIFVFSQSRIVETMAHSGIK